MGYIRNHAIIVTAEDYGSGDLEVAHCEATRIFPWVSPISPPAINRSRSFFIPPDGSKEGWTESDDGDKRRERFRKFLMEGFRYSDGSSKLHWIEIEYPGDDQNTVRWENWSHVGVSGGDCFLPEEKKDETNN